MRATRATIVAGVSAAALALHTGCAGTYDRGAAGQAYYAAPGDPVSISLFYDELSPWGRWIEYEPWGWCWMPWDVPPYWRPYRDGFWTYTDYGWTWISDEPWGWATCHYGRWLFDPAYGWLWMPDTLWAPAWVAWRSGPDWAGWAPLPPAAIWDVTIGLRFADVDGIPPSHWCFVDRRHLSDRKVRDHVASVTRNVTLLSETLDRTRFDARDGVPLNRGVDASDVRRLEVGDVTSPRESDRIGGGKARFFRPEIRDDAGSGVTPPGPPPRRAAPPDKPVVDRRALEEHLAKEQARMAHRHEEELAARAPGGAGAIHRRQSEEKQAFADYAAKERHAMESRRAAAEPPSRAPKPKKPREKHDKPKDPSDKSSHAR